VAGAPPDERVLPLWHELDLVVVGTTRNWKVTLKLEELLRA
jgi:hypothetical protein